MAPIPDGDVQRPPEPRFSVIHQKVDIFLDLPGRKLLGETEITIIPHAKDLKKITLNCRQCRLENLRINGTVATGVSYKDPYAKAYLRWEAGVHQYHILQERLGQAFKDEPEAELVVGIPEGVKIEELDPISEEAQSIQINKSFGSTVRASEAGVQDIIQVPRTAIDQSFQFAPITLWIQFGIDRIRDGMQFVGLEESDQRYPQAYTTNSGRPGSTCCLFPCVDSGNARCTWEISLRVPRTVRDLAKRKSIITRKLNARDQYAEHGALMSTFSEEDKVTELTVLCSGEMVDEIIKQETSSTKTVYFRCNKEISAQHIGFAIGVFEEIDLSTFRTSEDDDRLGQNAVPVHAYCTPGRGGEVKNTCFPVAQAIDYNAMHFGSFPYANYSLCFVDDAYTDALHCATLTICSNRLLFPDEHIDQIEDTTRKLVHALATQWVGIDLVPKEPEDTWAIVGIAYFMTDTYMRKLCGRNDYRYRQKLAADKVVKLDVDRPSLRDLGLMLTMDPLQLEFMALKAPLVLFILDQRMLKGGSLTGVSRVISKLFLNAKVGDIPEGALDTAYFIRQCEKIGHTKLESFFAQWIDGSGCPSFRITQRFNKKKLVVEMVIQQVQIETPDERPLKSETFMRDVKEDQVEAYAGIQPCFTGPMTIRIHEADGTPYEHIIEIKEPLHRLDIPYNTKYKRLRRNRRQRERGGKPGESEFAEDEAGDVLLYSLGDVLTSEDEVKEWQLSEWEKDDEEKMSQESYEWIRIDSDFEWICSLSFGMPPYMWISQLQQDRDVVAQLQSVQYLNSQSGHPLLSTFLVRTLMDTRYFHGVRTAAAAAMSKSAKQEIGWVGLMHLEKAFQALYCYPGSSMTLPNDFSDRAAYLVRCAISQSISRVRDPLGKSPYRARKWLFDNLKYNDNSSNRYSDSHYVAVFIKGLADAHSSRPLLDDHEDLTDLEEDSIQFHSACLEEMDRFRRVDEWIPSYHNTISQATLEGKLTLIRANALELSLVDFLQYTSDTTSVHLRLKAYDILMNICKADNSTVLQFFLTMLATEPSPYLREQMILILSRTLGSVAIGESSDSSRPAASTTTVDVGGLLVETEASTETRKSDHARKHTVSGALDALKAELGSNQTLKTGLWTAISSPTLSLSQVWSLLELCEKIYVPHTSMVLKLRFPRYPTVCSYLGKRKDEKGRPTAVVVFKEGHRIRTELTDKSKISAIQKQPSNLTLKFRPSSIGGEMTGPSVGMLNVASTARNEPTRPEMPRKKSSGGVTRTVIKPPKAPTAPATIDNTQSAEAKRKEGSPESVKKPIKIKLKLSGGGGGGGAGSPA